MGYITGTEGIVMKQDKILKILKGVYNRGDPPLSIPNREVKPLSADGTALWWESRLAPNFEEGVQKGKIPPCRIGYLISVSNRDTNKSRVPNTFWTPSFFV